MAQDEGTGDKPGDDQLAEADTEHLDEDPEKGPPPLGYGGKPGEPATDERPDSARSTGRTVQ